MKNVLIVVLLVLLGFMTYVAWHNATPICDDLVRNPVHGELICEYSLGDIPEDKAHVRIR